MVCPGYYLIFTALFLKENVFSQATDFSPKKWVEHIPFVSQRLSLCQGYHLNGNRLYGFHTNLTLPTPALHVLPLVSRLKGLSSHIHHPRIWDSQKQAIYLVLKENYSHKLPRVVFQLYPKMLIRCDLP